MTRDGHRHLFDAAVLTLLNDVFAEYPYPSPETLQELADEIGVSVRTTKVWFQNRRARTREYMQCVQELADRIDVGGSKREAMYLAVHTLECMSGTAQKSFLETLGK